MTTYCTQCRYNTYTGKHNELEAFGMKKSMEDLFYKYHVNAAFSGHVHAYERFPPIYDNVTTNNATIYFTVGAGGQSYGKVYVTPPFYYDLSIHLSFSLTLCFSFFLTISLLFFVSLILSLFVYLSFSLFLFVYFSFFLSLSSVLLFPFK